MPPRNPTRRAKAAPPPRRAGIRDVAERAKVSLQTVSNVVNRPEIVSPDTAARVREAITELGFSADHRARALRYGTSRTIACVTTDAEDSSFFAKPYFGRLLRGVIAGLEGDDHAPLVHMVRSNDPSSLKELFATGRIDGALVAGAVAPLPVLDEIRDWGHPIVFFDRDVEDAPSVSADFVTPVVDLVRHVAERGARRFAFLGGHLESSDAGSTAAARLAGFKQGLKLVDLPCDSSMVLDVGWTIEAGRAALHRLASENRRPDAVVAASDALAVGVLRAAADLGVAVPSELKVTGFDDDEMSASVSPALTTARLDLEEMATCAVHILLELIRNPRGRTPKSVQFHPRLVIRAST